MEYLVTSIIGFLMGSIPSAYIIVKRKKGINIFESGSGNAGAYNSYEVSNSRVIGILVLLADALKGILSVLITITIYPESFALAGLALLFAVFTHCYNPWFSFKGGRGLATAAGGAAILFPYLLIVWAVLWVIFYLMKKDIHLSNIVATIMSLLIFFGSTDIALKYTYPSAESESIMVMIATVILMIIFIKHIEPLNELILKLKSKGKI